MSSTRQNKDRAVGTRADVLLVEDEPAAREAVCLFLRRIGFRVKAAASAAEAFAAADAQTPQILVCDWRLGRGPDGVEVARVLQGRFHMPVVFVSAHPLDELREATEDIDMAQYLRKPVSLENLVSAIEAAT